MLLLLAAFSFTGASFSGHMLKGWLVFRAVMLPIVGAQERHLFFFLVLQSFYLYYSFSHLCGIVGAVSAKPSHCVVGKRCLMLLCCTSFLFFSLQGICFCCAVFKCDVNTAASSMGSDALSALKTSYCDTV